MRIAVVAASSRLEDHAELAERLAPVMTRFPGVELVYRIVEGRNNRSVHFAGADGDRSAMLVRTANDETIDAIWFARGGYGSNRIAQAAFDGFDLNLARRKKWLGYSDAGFLLAGLYARGCTVAHGPMPKDLLTYGDDDGAEAVGRALNWLTGRSEAGLESGLLRGQSYAAFNISVFAALLGTPLEPDLTGHVLMLEEVDEHLYATDRDLYRITSAASVRRIAGLRLGRVHALRVPDEHCRNPQPQPFDETAEQIARRWCRDAGIAFLEPADIGHDSANKVVPFGRF